MKRCYSRDWVRRTVCYSYGTSTAYCTEYEYSTCTVLSLLEPLDFVGKFVDILYSIFFIRHLLYYCTEASVLEYRYSYEYRKYLQYLLVLHALT